MCIEEYPWYIFVFYNVYILFLQVFVPLQDWLCCWLLLWLSRPQWSLPCIFINNDDAGLVIFPYSTITTPVSFLLLLYLLPSSSLLAIVGAIDAVEIRPAPLAAHWNTQVGSMLWETGSLLMTALVGANEDVVDWPSLLTKASCFPCRCLSWPQWSLPCIFISDFDAGLVIFPYSTFTIPVSLLLLLCLVLSSSLLVLAIVGADDAVEIWPAPPAVHWNTQVESMLWETGSLLMTALVGANEDVVVIWLWRWFTLSFFTTQLLSCILGFNSSSSSFSSSLLLLLSKASRYPYCPLTLLPGDPPPVLMYAVPIVPFSGKLLDVPCSHPLSAPVPEDSLSLIIPAPPRRD